MNPHRKGLVVVAVVVLLGGLAVWFGRRNESSLHLALPEAMVVVYKVDGSARSASITMQTPTGTSQQHADVPLRRKSDGSEGLTFSFSSGDFLYISAQNDGGGTITCHILVDGVEVSTNTAQGDYAIASCES